MSDTGTTVLTGPRPDCDLCTHDLDLPGIPAAFDGKTKGGPWGYMCSMHFTDHGTGLGTGKGHVLLDPDGSLPHGVWDTDALRRDFTVDGFALGYAVVKRKDDGSVGSLAFTHSPRFYYGWALDG